MPLKKKIAIGLLNILLISLFYTCKSIRYGIDQGVGQWKVLKNAVPVKEILNDPKQPDSVKIKLLLIEEIRKFAVDSLGMTNSKNYQKLYDQGGKPILKLVIASEPYTLKVKQWKFPFIGSFDYKGFFKFADANKLEKELQQQGYDTYQANVAAWSTLGWFKDPILSSMLEETNGDLADLIIHELTHSTLFVKNNHELSENIANFVGKYGSILFMTHKYGKNSAELNEYLKDIEFQVAYKNFHMEVAQKTQKLYITIDTSQKVLLKKQHFENLKQQRDSLYKTWNVKNFSKKPLNNAYLVGFLTYNSQQDSLENLLNTQYKGNFKLMFNSLKKQYIK
jgi:predicted aminopeptidase